jgi:outer membrane protein, multidrug efflux system
MAFTACKLPYDVRKNKNKEVPASYNSSVDSTNSGQIQWKEFLNDPYLTTLIDSALANNQELNIVRQEVNISQNEVKARKGEYLPFLGILGGVGTEKVGRYTSQGANDANTDIKPGQAFPEPLPDYMMGVNVSWELDVWKKLRNAKKSAMLRYFASNEGKNYVVTRLVSEIANSYYELLALDNQVEILQTNINILQKALEIVKLQKIAARITELGVKRFEAEVLKNQSKLYYVQQKIVETENRINFLIGRYPQTIQRDAKQFVQLVPQTIQAGVPSQLIQNRPDIRQAGQSLAAAKLDVKSARASFYPAVHLAAGLGFQAFNPSYLLQTPESAMYNIAGDLMAPLLNRKAIKAAYYTANSKQEQAIYNYEQTILNAYIEVLNQLNNIDNLQKSYDIKAMQVQVLTESIDISNVLFKSARADYMEVLLTQRDALESRFELIETKLQQMHAVIDVYRALGGGWQ